jgi:hypothetical protein
MAEVPVEQLREAVEHLHGAPATFVRVHYVEDRFRGELAWSGEVHEFALSDGRPVYAWSHYEDDSSELRRFVAVLGGGKIDGPTAAVRAAVLQQAREHGR